MDLVALALALDVDLVLLWGLMRGFHGMGTCVIVGACGICVASYTGAGWESVFWTFLWFFLVCESDGMQQASHARIVGFSANCMSTCSLSRKELKCGGDEACGCICFVGLTCCEWLLFSLIRDTAHDVFCYDWSCLHDCRLHFALLRR